jgi:hypothetical protein
MFFHVFLLNKGGEGMGRWVIICIIKIRQNTVYEPSRIFYTILVSILEFTKYATKF